MDKLSYGLGLGIGQQLAQMGIEHFSIEDFSAAVRDVIEGNELKIGHREAQTHVQQYFQKREEELNKEREAKGKEAKVAGEKFLEDNAKKEGVVTCKSGLQYMVLKEGAKYRFFIPYLLAYGPSGAGNSIPPYAALIFDVELLNVL